MFSHQEKSKTPDQITADKLIDKIQFLAEQKKQLSKSQVESKLKEIYYYFNHPSQVSDASYYSGINAIRVKYAPLLMRINLHLQHACLLSKKDVKRVNAAISDVIQCYKVNSAYSSLNSGKKFIKAAGEVFNEDQPNPALASSKLNLQKLITDLKNLPGGNPNKYCGIGDDEIELFGFLLNLPYKLQHATNYYYPALNAGSLDSYTELNCHNPEYESPFSTKGNINKLGNGGFVFFRLYVEPVNNATTRYGDSSLVFDLSLLRRCGWISMHDQLNPFPSKSPNTRHIYWQKRLLRTSQAVALNNQSKSDKGMWGGLEYRYRTSSIKSYSSGRMDTLKSFGKSINVDTRVNSFTSEMFYGEDILLGIALSVIRELRYLNECGFRAFFLKQLSLLNPKEQTLLLGELIKNLFRIEGKYPVAIRVKMNHVKNHLFFKPIAKSDLFHKRNRLFSVVNPDGNGCYNIDMSTNETAMQLAFFKEQEKKGEEKLSVARQQRRRYQPGSPEFNKWDAEVSHYEDVIETSKQELIKDQKDRKAIITFFIRIAPKEINAGTFEKIDTYKLKLIYQNYKNSQEGDIACLDTLLSLNILQLRSRLADDANIKPGHKA